MELPLLVLDLDETLIYASEKGLERKPDFLCGPYLIYRRPYLNDLVESIRGIYRLGVWTSSTENYMECVITNVFPADLDLEFTWGRERRTRVFDPISFSETWIKDLKKLKRRGYSLDRVLMVDNSPAKLRRQYGNLLRVTEWLGSPEDDELSHLGRYLAQIHGTPSFREIEKRGWRTAT